MFGVRAGRAFDGERVVSGGALVLFDGGRIVGVEPGAAPAADGCEVLEAPGGTVLPGLVDAHVHLCADGADGSLDRIEEPSEDGMAAVSGGFATAGTQVMLCQFILEELRVVVGGAHAAGLPVTAHAHGLPAVHMAMAAGVDGIEHCSFLTDKGVSQSAEDLARLADAGTAVCPTLGFAGVPPLTPTAAALLDKLGMTFEQVMEMRKRQVGQMHAAGVHVMSVSDGGIAAAKPHGLLPVSVAFLVEGGVS